MNTKTENKICTDCKKEFEINSGDFILYEKVGIELPVLCYWCRTRLLFSFWGFGKFRKTVSSLSGDNLITTLPNNLKYPIYKTSEWYSDKWDAMDYGVEYFEKESFLKQFDNLRNKVPHPHQTGRQNTGCDYCNDVWSSKDCYLSRSMVDCENLLYSYRNLGVKNSIDVSVCFYSEKCFDSLDCHNSYKLFYSMHSRDCIDSYFLFDCRNCQNCFMCWNLRNKSYCIENVQHSKEEYEERLKSFSLDSYKAVQFLKNRLKELAQKEAVHRENFNIKAYNSSGNFLIDVKDCINCNTINVSKDCINCLRGTTLNSSIDLIGCWASELLGNCCGCQDSFSLKYCLWSASRYSEYLDLCIECEYCFGCVGLRKKKYCILNKQYTKEEYENLKEKITSNMKNIGEYGKFLPYSMNSEPFNFSTSMFYFPETKKEDILGLGGCWEDVDESKIEGMSTDKLPDSIKEVNEDITTQALICPETGWRFNVTKNELSFYKENNIPLPRYHFDMRTKRHLKYLTVLRSYPYNCFYCKKEINAFYPPEWGYNKVACEECYKQNIA